MSDEYERDIRNAVKCLWVRTRMSQIGELQLFNATCDDNSKGFINYVVSKFNYCPYCGREIEAEAES